MTIKSKNAESELSPLEVTISGAENLLLEAASRVAAKKMVTGKNSVVTLVVDGENVKVVESGEEGLAFIKPKNRRSIRRGRFMKHGSFTKGDIEHERPKSWLVKTIENFWGGEKDPSVETLFKNAYLKSQKNN